MLFMLSVVLLMLLGFGIFSLPVSTDDFTPNGLSASNRRMAVERDGHGLGKREEQWTEIVSWEPRAFLYHNFLFFFIVYSLPFLLYMLITGEEKVFSCVLTMLTSGQSKEECEYLISLAKPHMTKSTVVDSETGKSKDSRVRTSSGMFLRRGQDKIIRSIEKRIADFSFIPADHGEGLQILHYEIGQKYEPHFDYFLDEFNTKNGGQRTATLLMYLSDVEEGGETVFPSAKANASSVPWWNELSECGKKGLSLKPKRGNALLFWSTRPDASLDPTSLHGICSCPVIIGNKWSATKWMHLGEYKVS
ncbi:Probable prolyl 4-hydroxylase 3 [Linum perenne]